MLDSFLDTIISFVNDTKVYSWKRPKANLAGGLLLLALLLAACAAPPLRTELPEIEITLIADGEARALSVPAGSSVGDAIQAAGVSLGALDRAEPPLAARIEEDDTVTLVRVREEIELGQAELPFITRTLQNDSLPAGKRRILQQGANGSEEITYRLLYEDGELVSRTRLSAVVVAEPVEEIIMVGSQAPFSALSIPGRLALLAGGNAWLIEGATTSRTPLATTGDLDGRIFSLSPEGDWLLFTRAAEDDENINSLWALYLDAEDKVLVDTKVANVVHSASWVPGPTDQVAFSTVQPGLNPPGWQADNNLSFLNVTTAGDVTPPRLGLPKQTDGFYAWWGSAFTLSPDGEWIGYTRPNDLGVVDIDADELVPLLELIPFQTGSDWAWMPAFAWAPDSRLIYSVAHAELPGLENQERSPRFDLVAVSPEGGAPLTLAEDVGMFSIPAPSPLTGGDYTLAYLRAYTPAQSDISGYQLVVADRDGSNARQLFPPAGAVGLQPQRVAWSPRPDDNGELWIALIYQGNLWLVNAASGEARQISNDGLATSLDWR